MKPYAELLEFNQPNPIRVQGHTRIRDSFPGLLHEQRLRGEPFDHFDHAMYDPERIIEFAGRWDYGENNARKLGEASKVHKTDPVTGSTIEYSEVPIVQKYLEMGHESMIEVAHATFFIECSRVVSHELVRHRIASYQQESQRFVKYDGVDTSLDVFYIPDEVQGDPDVRMAVMQSLATYKELRSKGVAPQLARYVLPNAMRTRLVMSTNIREWRHIIRLRLDKSAQPEMRELMQQIHDQLIMVFPNAMHGVLDNGRGVR